jgi:hypothetical protein
MNPIMLNPRKYPELMSNPVDVVQVNKLPSSPVSLLHSVSSSCPVNWLQAELMNKRKLAAKKMNDSAIRP